MNPENRTQLTDVATVDPSGYDAGKKVKGRKRHILIDTFGLLPIVVRHPADLQKRDGLRLILDRHSRRLFPIIERIFADANCQGPKMAAAVAMTRTWSLEVVKSNELHRFVVLPQS